MRDTDGERAKEAGRLRARLGVLEGREGEKGRRWEELERRVCRVEKVRQLLRDDAGGGRRVVSAGVVEGKGMVDGEGGGLSRNSRPDEPFEGGIGVFNG